MNIVSMIKDYVELVMEKEIIDGRPSIAPIVSTLPHMEEPSEDTSPIIMALLTSMSDLYNSYTNELETTEVNNIKEAILAISATVDSYKEREESLLARKKMAEQRAEDAIKRNDYKCVSDCDELSKQCTTVIKEMQAELPYYRYFLADLNICLAHRQETEKRI